MSLIKETLQQAKQAVENHLLIMQKNQSVEIANQTKKLLGLSDKIEIKANYADSIYLFLDKKEILSIHARTYGKPYLNTYATTLDSAFEFERLVINGKVAEKFLEDSNLFEKIFKCSFKNSVAKAQQKIWELAQEISRIEAEELEAKKQIALKSFFEGNEIKFENMQTIQYARGRYDTINRVVGIKLLAASKDKSRVNIEFECKNWNEEGTTKVSRENVMLKYIQNHII